MTTLHFLTTQNVGPYTQTDAETYAFGAMKQRLSKLKINDTQNIAISMLTMRYQTCVRTLWQPHHISHMDDCIATNYLIVDELAFVPFAKRNHTSRERESRIWE